MICPKCKTKLIKHGKYLYHSDLGCYNWNCYKWTVKEYKKRGI